MTHWNGTLQKKKYGTVRFGTVRYGQGDKFGRTTVLLIFGSKAWTVLLQFKHRFPFIFLPANRTVAKTRPFSVFMVKRQEWYCKKNKSVFYFHFKSRTVPYRNMVRLPFFRYGSRYKILTENGNELFTVRFALYNEKTEHDGLFAAVRLAVKNRKGKRCFYATVRLTLFFRKRKTVRFKATLPRFFKSKSRKW